MQALGCFYPIKGLMNSQINHLAAFRRYVPRINSGGNYCGHDPQAPQFVLTKPAKTGKGGLPAVIIRAMERVQQYYASPRRIFPSLDLVNGSTRQQRSERREACICTLAALLKHTDLATLKVGIPTSSGFVNLSFQTLRKQTMLSEKRFERAVRDLKAAGFITVAQPKEELAPGKWISHNAVKAISASVFALVGLAKALQKERVKASKRQSAKNKVSKERPEQGTMTSRYRVRQFLAAAFGKPGRKKPHNYQEPLSDHQRTELQKMLTNIMAELRYQHPEWPSEKIKYEAKLIMAKAAGM